MRYKESKPKIKREREKAGLRKRKKEVNILNSFEAGCTTTTTASCHSAEAFDHNSLSSFPSSSTLNDIKDRENNQTIKPLQGVEMQVSGC